MNKLVVDRREYETEKRSLCGMEIKAIVGIEGNYQLYLMVEGTAPDQAISDAMAISLEGPMKQLFSVPPTWWG